MLLTLLLVAAPSECLFALQQRPTSQPSTPEPLVPELAAASGEGQQALSTFRVPNDFTAELYAAEPLLANPVAIYIDDQGKVYVCETYRQKKGIEDNRDHAEWLLEDLAAQSVEDRLAYIRKHLGDQAIDYARHDDRIRLLVDTDGDSLPDKATVYADHFNDILAGTGAGVLAHRGSVYYTCIPDVWKLRDTNGDGVADERASLHYGYGVRYAFRGHDMHGLIIGPDGRLYFSIGDRGYNIATPEGSHLKDPASGAVFRCDLDGSNLEVFATGLRNPQELAFDEHGNLFTGDNNSDSEDLARWVYVVEGGDTGWRMYYQYLSDRGPFNREKIWHPFHEGQPAYIIPPIANVSDGPSGLVYYPGTGCGEDFKGRFLLCDFRGQASNSGVRSFRAKAKGAFFELTDSEELFWNILATDVAFGPDGGIYLSDWVHGWNGLNKGRIYRFTDKRVADDPVVAEVKQLLNQGLKSKSVEELAELLSHPDQRIRTNAQFALVDRTAIENLVLATRNPELGLGRLHAVWGLWQIGRRGESLDMIEKTLTPLLDDNDAELRAQAAKVAGELGLADLSDALIEKLSDNNARVRYFAATSLGKIKDYDSLDAVATMLEDNADRDPILRHGGIMAMVGAGNAKRLSAFKDHPSSSVRLAAVVAMRKRAMSEVSNFLDDSDEQVVLEAARAIYDLPMESEFAALAKVSGTALSSDALLRRVLNANYRTGGADAASRLAQFAAEDSATLERRLEALNLLASWDRPEPLDGVLGDYRPLPERDIEPARKALETQLSKLVDAQSPLAVEAATVAASLGIKQVAPTLVRLASDDTLKGATRVSALYALVDFDSDDVNQVVDLCLESDEAAIRAAALDVLSNRDPARALPLLRMAIESDDLADRQGALRTLGAMPGPEADAVIEEAMVSLNQGVVPPDTQLDLMEAAKQRATHPILALLTTFENQRLFSDDPLVQFSECLSGGDAERGASVFADRVAASCFRCHNLDDQPGAVGPNLGKIGAEKTPEYLLEAIVMPNKTIAKGYETVIALTIDGKIVSGIVKQEDDMFLQLVSPDGEVITIPQDDIEERRSGGSSMPADISANLSKADIRDLVEFLSSQKEVKVTPEGHE